jgi:HD-GYP domain-containing protein (c-di-GMP phosphodiesterase class II)
MSDYQTPNFAIYKPLPVFAPLRITLIYVLVGLFWIYFSDHVLLLFSQDINGLSFLQSIKGAAYVIVTAVLLYVLIHRDFSELNRSRMALQESYDATLEGWVRALDLRDKETEGHAQRVTALCLRVAESMDVCAEDLEHMQRGALLHDIGKIGVSDNILLKPGELTPEEWQVIRKHPVYAYEFLSPVAYLRPALDIPYCHHEKWDGSGYPRGLHGEQIPLAARIFAVVDVWDALRSDRPYRQAWSVSEAIAYLQSQAGAHFDPRVVQHFLNMPDIIT